MTPEEAQRMQSTMQFILEQQAQFTVNIQQLQEQQAQFAVNIQQLQEQQSRLAVKVDKLADTQAEHAEMLRILVQLTRSMDERIDEGRAQTSELQQTVITLVASVQGLVTVVSRHDEQIARLTNIVERYINARGDGSNGTGNA